MASIPKNFEPARTDLINTDLVDQAVYLDSPVVSALHQIAPFYRSGIFGQNDTPLLLRDKLIMRIQLLGSSASEGMNVRRVDRGQVSRLPITPSGVVFYPFNSQSNMNAVTNRDAFHVLTLHGESNKLASNRPAARLYDYICVAGPLAVQRYLDSKIFTPADVEQGRLIMMGDSFVQDLPWIRPTNSGETGALLYCPTWEGYGNSFISYSSVSCKQGFALLPEVAHSSGSDRIIIKPHPYLGLLKRRLMLDFVDGVRKLLAQGLRVELALAESSFPLWALCRMQLSNIVRIDETVRSPVAINLGLCDISGMEAIFLKQRIANMVISSKGSLPLAAQEIYLHKTLSVNSNITRAVQGYLGKHSEIDDKNRALVFGYQVPKLAEMVPDARRRWLINFVRSDPFWRRGSETAKKKDNL